MRQWHADPRIMCRQHLLGEHVEHHMFVGSIRKGVSLAGYRGLVETATLQDRHDALAAEMVRRGMRHESPLPPHGHPPFGRVDREASLRELLRRCPECQERAHQFKKGKL